MASASSSRRACGQAFRGVEGSVEQSATFALPLAHRQREAVVLPSASLAELRRRKPPIRFLEPCAMQAALVFELADELGQACIGDGASQSAVSHHACDVQRLAPDPCATLGGRLVVRFAPNVGDALVETGDAFLHRLSSVRSFPASSQCALVSVQLGQQPLERGRPVRRSRHPLADAIPCESSRASSPCRGCCRFW